MDINRAIFIRLRKYIPVELWDALMKAITKEDYSQTFVYMDRQYRIDAYSSIFEFIPDNKKYELFIDAYIMPDIGLVKPKIISKIFELRPKELAQFLKEMADDKGYITIYRGESAESTKVQRALSWTLDRNTGIWFAKRLDSSDAGYLYTAKVHINNVIAYITDREEEEILIQYKDVEIIGKEKIIITAKD